jgi:hypothetical protein
VNVLKGLRRNLTKPTNELAAHFVVSVMALVAIALTDHVVSLLGIGLRTLPFAKITLTDWMFDLDIISATVVNAVGTIKAVIVLWEA